MFETNAKALNATVKILKKRYGTAKNEALKAAFLSQEVPGEVLLRVSHLDSECHLRIEGEGTLDKDGGVALSFLSKLLVKAKKSQLRLSVQTEVSEEDPEISTTTVGVGFGTSDFTATSIKEPLDFFQTNAKPSQTRAVPQEVFNALNRASAYAAKTYGRSLDYIQLKCEGSQVTVVASDGHALYHERVDADLSGILPEDSLLLHGKDVTLMSKLFTTGAEVAYENGWSNFEGGHAVVKLKENTEHYPNIAFLLRGRSNAVTITVDVAEMLEKVEHVLLCDSKLKALTLRHEAGTLTLSCEGTKAFSGSVSAEGSNTTFMCKISPALLKKALQGLEDGEVELDFLDGLSPLNFKQENRTLLLMPLSITS